MPALRSADAAPFWLASEAPPERARRPTFSGQHDADVCIVGAGYTGLWTAYYLSLAAPALRVVVVEARHAGFGASGRNGGWLSGALPGHPEVYARRGGEAGVRALQAELDGTIDEVGRVCRAEGIEAGLRKGGTMRVARTPAQAQRLQDGVAAGARWGAGLQWLDAGQAAEKINVHGGLGATFSPHCASIHPGRLVLGLAAAAEARGVTIFENSPVTSLAPGQVQTKQGSVRAPQIVLATEAYTGTLPGRRRSLLPMNSSMIITEPVPASVMATIGWRHGETLGDGAHVYIYAQRTADDRIALGGRGVPYRYGSSYDPAGRTPGRTVESLRRTLVDLFPQLGGVELASSWSGVLGVPRDWTASVGLDAGSGIAWAGGYTGHGVAPANLAGRTLADLLLHEETARTRLPWVGRTSPRWEPEPLRWAGVRGLYSVYRLADRLEARSGAGPSRLARVADLISRKP